MEDILLDDNSDQDRQFYNDGDNFYDTSYFSQNELTTEQKKMPFLYFFLKLLTLRILLKQL